MENYTRAELIEQIDYERRETNSRFISPIQTTQLLNRSVKRIIREPGIRTIPALQNITAVSGVSSITLNADFKEVISLWSGEGTTGGIEFTHKPVDEFNMIVTGYHYTFNENGKIDIKCGDVGSLPSQTLKLRYWSKNIILDQDGVTYKRKWENDEDTSALGDEFDDFYIEFSVANILRREGKKEWKDRLSTALEILGNLKEQSGNKTRKTSRNFGFYKFNI